MNFFDFLGLYEQRYKLRIGISLGHYTCNRHITFTLHRFGLPTGTMSSIWLFKDVLLENRSRTG